MLRDHPTNPDALYVRAMSLYYAGNTEDASKLLASALKCDPDHANARTARKRVRDLVALKEEGNTLFKERKFSDAHKTCVSQSRPGIASPHSLLTGFAVLLVVCASLTRTPTVFARHGSRSTQ